jgi:hypothetical protein
VSRMRRRLGAIGLAAAVVGASGMAQAEAAAPAASSGATLYVNIMSASCTDSGTGTQAAPYCSLQAAANAASPGDTVSITGTPGYYGAAYGNLTISKSGTAAAPITFAATGTTYTMMGALTVSGSYVNVSGLYAVTSGTGTGIRVNGSHDALNSVWAVGNNAPAVIFGGTASADTLSRSDVDEYGATTAAQILSGASGIVLTTNQISNIQIDGAVTGDTVTVNGAANTDVTSNTILVPCNGGLGVTGSTHTSIENNIVEGIDACTSSDPANLSVDSASASSTTLDYNELSQMANNVNPYSWAGKTYATQSAFHTATGQGAHDEDQQDVQPGTFTMPSGVGDGVADANPAAPGELTTDFYGNTWSGAAPDRGAVAIEEFTGAGVDASAWGQQAGVTIDLKGVAWGSTGTYSVDWGDGQADADLNLGDSIPDDFSSIQDSHMYARPGTYTVTAIVKDPAQTVTRTATVTTTGSAYLPVTPTRVLDTRRGLGAPQAKIGADGTISVDVTSGVTVPAGLGTITAAVLNVTATDETGNGVITAYPDGGTLPQSSNVNFSAGHNVPNLVTVKVGADHKVDFHNGSSASTDLLADVAGYYVQATDGSSYYLPNSPDRVLDTRSGIGGVSGAVGPGATVSLSVPQCTQGTGSSKQTATATAVAMNVTAVSPTANGVITAYPDGAALPTASNLNYYTGHNIPNMVVVAVGADGKVEFHNTSTGSVQLVADLEGCYSQSLGSAFVPLNPSRELDTRSGLGENSSTGVPVAANKDALWYSNSGEISDLWNAAAVVMNVTVTDTKANGFITAYPESSTLPNASNLNFLKGQTVPNLVMVATDGQIPVALHNSSTGSVDLIADLFGYFG